LTIRATGDKLNRWLDREIVASEAERRPMPIYEYLCRRCGNRFSLLRPMREADAPTPCPECGAAETKRLPSLVAARGAACAPTG
jgi:putative FmdB family regulatory protein